MVPALLPIAVASVILLATPLAAQNATTRRYTVYNKCPTPINLYIGGSVKDSTIAINGSVTKTLGTDPGFFYTDANNGSSNAVGSIRAGFYNDFYYIVSDPNHANTGLQVAPISNGPTNGFCEAIECDGRGCAQAFPQPPTTVPILASSPRVTPPYYRCPYPNTDYNITFCPTGEFVDQGQPIHLNFYKNKCLEAQGPLTNGSVVQIYECNGAKGQRWNINRGSTKVQVAGTNFCLDGDSFPQNGAQLKIQPCTDNIPAQKWYYTNDNRIALEDQGFCTDLTDGNSTNTNPVQVWTCADENDNQVWNL